MNHQEIKRFNPQRYPIALVDRILKCQSGSEVVAIKAITATEPCYAEIPDDADISAMAYPYSLMIESFCQAAGPLCAQLGLVFLGKVMLFASMGDIEFLGHAFPGDVMTHRVRLIKLLSDAAVVSGEITANGHVIARFGQLMVVAREASVLVVAG
jgi:3-hydroxyacyl-[acyl-carrier-protein] dehydratase